MGRAGISEAKKQRGERDTVKHTALTLSGSTQGGWSTAETCSDAAEMGPQGVGAGTMDCAGQ